MKTYDKSPYIENAIVLEDFIYSAKINIPSIMPFITIGKPKDNEYNISCHGVLNEDNSFFVNTNPLKTSNYYQLDNVGEGFKNSNILISFISEDINNIISLSL